MTVLAASQSILNQPGTVAFLIIFGMGVILFFVFRSMSKHLRKIDMAARAEAEAAARSQRGMAPGGTEFGADSPSQAGSADWSA